MSKWQCTGCPYIYDPQKGDPKNGMPAGTRWDDLPEDWVCPVCGLGRDMFEEIKE